MENHRYTPKHAESKASPRHTNNPQRTRASGEPVRKTYRKTGDDLYAAEAPQRRNTRRSVSAEPQRTRRGRTSRYRDADLFENEAHAYERRPLRRKKAKTGCALASLYFICIFGIALCISLVLIFSANDVLALVKPDQDISIVVAEDTTVDGISDQLDASGVVNYGMVFRLFNALQGDSDTIISAGTYTLNPTMDYDQIVSALTQTTSTTTVKVTIPEGYTIKQIRQTLLDNQVTSESLLDDALNNYPFKHEFLKDLQPPEDNWLEGYLFPDTYEFVQDSKQPVYEVINVMLNNFDDKYDEQIQEGAEELGLTTNEVVIIASLIEREAREEDEFAMISGVIHNRLNHSDEFPYLQIDASLQYAVGHNNPLTEADLQLDSPYNLYTHEGLPPGPICNPGYRALYAATHPDDHDYYYYVAMPDGTHLFAETNSEHNRNRERADEAWAEAEAE